MAPPARDPVSALEVLRTLLAWAVPPALRTGPESARTWVVVACMVLADLVAVPAILIRVAQGHPVAEMWPAAAGATLSALCLAALHVWPARRTAIIGTFWAGTALAISANGVFGDGIAAGGISAVSLVPIATVYLLGSRAGFVAVLGVSAILAALASVSAAGIYVFPHRATVREEELVGLSIALSTTWMSWFIVWAYETQRQRTMVRLAVGEHRYHFALQAEGAGVAEWGAGAESCFVTDRLRTLLSLAHTPDQLPTETLFAAVDERGRAALDRALRAALDQGDAFRIETVAPRVGLPPIHLVWEGAAEDRPSGERAVIAIVRDVSEEHRVALLKDDFVATVSHELRSPLTTIRGALGMLQAGVGVELDADGAEILRLALSGTNRLTMLVNDLLDAQRLELGRLPLELGPADILEIARGVVSAHRQFASERSVGLEAHHQGEHAPVLVSDARRVEQVLTNLVHNACKYTHPGTTIDVRVLAHGHGVRVEVEDRGPGIPTSFQPHVFEKFSQAWSGSSRQGGSGLGLSISRALTQRLGGAIGFHSVEGKGSTFWVELPPDPPSAEPQAG